MLSFLKNNFFFVYNPAPSNLILSAFTVCVRHVSRRDLCSLKLTPSSALDKNNVRV